MNTTINQYDFSKPFFYNNNIGIRFEIGIGDTNDEAYITNANTRAITIFEDLFDVDVDDDILIIVNSFRENDETNSISNNILDCLREDICLSYNILPNIYDEEDEDYKMVQFYIESKLRQLDYKELIKMICNSDFGIEPMIDDEIYVVNITKDLVYHLYDDRGLDIVSNDVDILKDIYHKRNSWILEYDRQRIDSIFIK